MFSGQFHAGVATRGGTHAVAVSIDNSIFVASGLFLDPSSTTPDVPVRRITGNIGKPGFAILIPPAEPKIRQADCNSWRVVSHQQFDGKMQNNFASTTLHLSLTGYELAARGGEHGMRDQDCLYVEAAISLHEGGKWIADLDVIKTHQEWKLWQTDPAEQTNCSHKGKDSFDVSEIQPLVSIDQWVEFLDHPLSDCVFRARGKAMARFAAASLSVQQKYDAVILSSKECWACSVKNDRHGTTDEPVDESSPINSPSGHQGQDINLDHDEISSTSFTSRAFAPEDEDGCMETLFPELDDGQRRPSFSELNELPARPLSPSSKIRNTIFICSVVK